ncbi:MAG: hypothetical protein RIG62_31255 [Cyclobacteriaceae bacterium]
MKKLLLSIGFAAGTVLFVNAQEVVPQEQPQPEEETEMMQETNTQQGMESQEGITLISEEELPQEVKDGLASSEFSDAVIEQAFELSGEAVPYQLVEQTTDEPIDEKFYQLQVNQDNEPAILYFDEQGELVEAQTM